jgi:hypothetical protein
MKHRNLGPVNDPSRTPGLSDRSDGEIELVRSAIVGPSGFGRYHEFGVTWPVPEEAVRRIFVQKMT